MWCVLCLDSILSLQARKQYICGDNSGIHESPRFPPLSERIGAEVRSKYHTTTYTKTLDSVRII